MPRWPDVGRFSKSEDLAWHLGEALEADLDGQVSARNHQAQQWTAHGGEQHLRESAEALGRLDLEHQTQVIGPDLFQ